MSDTDDPIMDEMLTKLRELELDHVQLAGRILQLNEDIALRRTGPRRKPGRPRKPDIIIEMPGRVAGGVAETPVEESAA